MNQICSLFVFFFLVSYRSTCRHLPYQSQNTANDLASTTCLPPNKLENRNDSSERESEREGASGSCRVTIRK